jgi:hypothetical protein
MFPFCAPRAIAAFISSIDTGFLPLRFRKPLNSRTDRVAALVATSPLPFFVDPVRFLALFFNVKLPHR